MTKSCVKAPFITQGAFARDAVLRYLLGSLRIRSRCVGPEWRYFMKRSSPHLGRSRAVIRLFPYACAVSLVLACTSRPASAHYAVTEVRRPGDQTIDDQCQPFALA